MPGRDERQGTVLFVTKCLWLQGCRSVADAKRIVWVYRGSLMSDEDSTTQNLGAMDVVFASAKTG